MIRGRALRTTNAVFDCWAAPRATSSAWMPEESMKSTLSEVGDDGIAGTSDRVAEGGAERIRRGDVDLAPHFDDDALLILADETFERVAERGAWRHGRVIGGFVHRVSRDKTRRLLFEP